MRYIRTKRFKEERWQERHVPTRLVNTDYIRYKFRPDRLRWFWESLETGEQVKHNEDLHPSGLLYGLLYWAVASTVTPRSPGWDDHKNGTSHLSRRGRPRRNRCAR